MVKLIANTLSAMAADGSIAPSEGSAERDQRLEADGPPITRLGLPCTKAPKERGNLAQIAQLRASAMVFMEI